MHKLSDNSPSGSATRHILEKQIRALAYAVLIGEMLELAVDIFFL